MEIVANGEMLTIEQAVAVARDGATVRPEPHPHFTPRPTTRIGRAQSAPNASKLFGKVLVQRS